MTNRRIQAGTVLDLVVTWGAQTRLKCARCSRYMGSEESDGVVACRSCGQRYKHVESTCYEVMAHEQPPS